MQIDSWFVRSAVHAAGFCSRTSRAAGVLKPRSQITMQDLGVEVQLSSQFTSGGSRRATAGSTVTNKGRLFNSQKATGKSWSSSSSYSSTHRRSNSTYITSLAANSVPPNFNASSICVEGIVCVCGGGVKFELLIRGGGGYEGHTFVVKTRSNDCSFGC